MSPETCSYHGQFDNEIKQLLENNAEMKADLRNVTYAVGRIEKKLDQMEDRMKCIEKEQGNQKVKDAKQDAKVNLLWTFLIEKNGLAILLILAYVAFGDKVL